MCDMHYRRFRRCNDIDKVSNDSLWGIKAHGHTEEFKKWLSEKYRGRKGYPHTQAHKDFMSKLQTGEHNGMWKGNDICYSTLHTWVRRHLPIPEKCPDCGLIKRLNACNISGKYLRNKSDWEYLCQKCHCIKYNHSGHNLPNPSRLLLLK